MSVLVCENIVKMKRNQEIIKNFSYNFLENKTYALVGKYDSKRLELLNIISSKTKATQGNIYLDGILIENHLNINKKICFIDNLSFPRFFKVMDIFKLMNKYYPNWDTYYAFQLAQYIPLMNLCNH